MTAFLSRHPSPCRFAGGAGSPAGAVETSDSDSVSKVGMVGAGGGFRSRDAVAPSAFARICRSCSLVSFTSPSNAPEKGVFQATWQWRFLCFWYKKYSNPPKRWVAKNIKVSLPAIKRLATTSVVAPLFGLRKRSMASASLLKAGLRFNPRHNKQAKKKANPVVVVFHQPTHEWKICAIVKMDHLPKVFLKIETTTTKTLLTKK